MSKKAFWQMRKNVQAARPPRACQSCGASPISARAQVCRVCALKVLKTHLAQTPFKQRRYPSQYVPYTTLYKDKWE